MSREKPHDSHGVSRDIGPPLQYVSPLATGKYNMWRQRVTTLTSQTPANKKVAGE